MEQDDIGNIWYGLYADEGETVGTVVDYMAKHLAHAELWLDGRAQSALIEACSWLAECVLRCTDAQRLPTNVSMFSIHKPMHQALAIFMSLLHCNEGPELLQHVMQRTLQEMAQSRGGRVEPLSSEFEPLAMWPLRSLVFNLQHRAGLWRRNGQKAHTHAQIYTLYNRGTLDRDLYLVQLMCMFAPPNAALAHIVRILFNDPTHSQWLQLILSGHLAGDAFPSTSDDTDRSQAVWLLRDFHMLILAILTNENCLGLNVHVRWGMLCVAVNFGPLLIILWPSSLPGTMLPRRHRHAGPSVLHVHRAVPTVCLGNCGVSHV